MFPNAKSLFVAGLLVSAVLCRPRDTHQDGEQDSTVLSFGEPHIQNKEIEKTQSISGSIAFHRLPCSSKDPADEEVCTEYCNSKGFHNGVCVNYGCHCV